MKQKTKTALFMVGFGVLLAVVAKLAGGIKNVPTFVKTQLKG